MPFTLKDYSDIKELARGGMSRIYCATQISLNRQVVIKEMAAGLLTTQSEIKRFENEAQASASLSHDNIIRIYDYGEENGSFYIAMEYIDGSDLDILLQDKRFPREIGLMILHQALRGLSFAHEKGVVHRDVKAANILVGRNGAVKVSDFGLAYAGGSSTQLTSTAALVGTPAYMSPELVNGEETRSARMDIWAAGVMLYRLITGEFPFTGENVPSTLINIIQKRETPAEDIDKTIPSALAGQLHACLEKDRAKRLSVFGPLIAALQDYSFDLGVRDPVGLIQRYFTDKKSALEELRLILAKYHGIKGKEFQEAGKYSTALAHYREALQHDGGNGDIAKAVSMLEKLEAATLTAKTTNVQDYVVTQVRSRGKVGARRWKTILGVLGCVAIAVGILGPARLRHWHAQSLPRHWSLHDVARDTKSSFVHVRERFFKPGLSQDNQKTGRDGAPGNSQELPSAKSESSSIAKSVADFGKGQKGLQTRAGSDVAKKESSGTSGLVRVSITPLSAVVIIDDKDTMSPAQRSAGVTLTGGVHKFAVFAEGFVSATPSVTVAGNDTQALTIDLGAAEKKPGGLQVLSDISAEVYVDGEFRGNAPTQMPIVLSEGQHTLIFKRSGYKPYQNTVTIRAGEIRDFKLESGSGSPW
jgi:tRNA A-37 threonylcarbamoyl transferase component Bud32